MPRQTLTIWLSFVAVATLHTANFAAPQPFKKPGPNIALGKSYTWDLKPSYRLCLDAGDKTQLTDGDYVPGCAWTKKGVVGWNRARGGLVLTIDLGEVQPIAGISYHTAAGRAEVMWPTALMLFVSDDNKRFHPLGDLIDLSPEPPKVGDHYYRTAALKTYGRYVAIGIHTTRYIFSDEIEVYRGKPSFLETSRPGPVVTDLRAYMRGRIAVAGVRRRILEDIDVVTGRLEKAELPTTGMDLLTEAARKVEIPLGSDFRCIMPLNALHAGVYARNAAVLRAGGVKDFTVWSRCRWDPLDPLDPPKGPAPSLAVRLMPNEYRAQSLNLTNPSDEPQPVTVTIRGLGGPPARTWIEAFEVLFTDTSLRRVIADPVEPLTFESGAWRLTVPAGMTKQLWFRFHPVGVRPGTHEGEIVLQAGRVVRTVPLSVRISTVSFPERISLTQCLWDYTDRPSYSFGLIGEDGIDLAIRDMQAHFVDQTWAHSSAAPRPKAADFNDRDELVGKLDWSLFDQWVKRWGGTPRYYIVYLSLSRVETFGGAKVGTPVFDVRVKAWAAAWRKHVLEIGLKPEQVGGLIWDEFTKDVHARHIEKWARPIKAGYPEFVIVETVSMKRPDQSAVPELFNLIDAFCPSFTKRYEAGGRPVADFYAKHQARGAVLWNYDNVPIDGADAYALRRLQQWRVWRYGMQGTGYWAYCDAGDGGSWNPYAATGRRWSLVYIGKGTLHESKHWEAWREGLEDHEYLVMLRKRIADAEKAGRAAGLVARGRRLLAEAPSRVLAEDSLEFRKWTTPKDRTMADQEIAKALDLLEAPGW